MNTGVSASTFPADGVTTVMYKLQGYLTLLIKNPALENKKLLKWNDESIALIGKHLFNVKKRYAYGK